MEPAGQVYRCYDANDNLLYVGMSVQVQTRLARHLNGTPWWGLVAEVRITRFPTWRNALEAEARAIADEKPLYNRTNTPKWLIDERTPRPPRRWEPSGTIEVPISQAKGRLTVLVRDSDENDVLLMRHGRPAAVLLSVRRHEALLEEIEDLRDRLSIHEREGLTSDLDKVVAELGLSG